MMPARDDDNDRRSEQERFPTTSPASVRAFWPRRPLPFEPITIVARTVVDDEEEPFETTRHRVRSKGIPMPMMRDSSSAEQQLHHERAEADARDYNMFLTLYSHLQQQRTQTKDQAMLDDNALCLNRLIETRYRHLHESSVRGGYATTMKNGAVGRRHFGEETTASWFGEPPTVDEDQTEDVGEVDIFQLDL
jgi:hypothetical protein